MPENLRGRDFLTHTIVFWVSLFLILLIIFRAFDFFQTFVQPLELFVTFVCYVNY